MNNKTKKLFKINQKETNKETNFALQIAYQVTQYDNDYVTYQFHRDILKEHISNELPKVAELISKKYKKLVKLCNLKAIALTERYKNAMSMLNTPSSNYTKEQYTSLLCEIIIMFEDIKKVFLEVSDHSWINDELESSKIYQQIVRDCLIYENGSTLMCFNKGSIHLVDKESTDKFSVFIRYRDNKFILDTFSKTDLDNLLGKF